MRKKSMSPSTRGTSVTVAMLLCAGVCILPAALVAPGPAFLGVGRGEVPPTAFSRLLCMGQLLLEQLGLSTVSSDPAQFPLLLPLLASRLVEVAGEAVLDDGRQGGFAV